jgi:hypothetical protein
VSIDEKKRGMLGAIGAFLENNLPFVHRQLKQWLPWLVAGADQAPGNTLAPQS